MENIVSLAVSLAYILLVLWLATLIAHVQGGRNEVSRKFVHVMVGNWVFVTPFFTSLWAVGLVPFVFIIVNALSIRFHFFTAMAREHDNLGTVYYAFSMFALKLRRLSSRLARAGIHRTADDGVRRWIRFACRQALGQTSPILLRP